MREILSFLRQHGTKALGYAMMAIGAVSIMDQALVISLFGEKGRSWILLLGGIGTALRGHTNTATIKDEIRVEEKAKEEVKVNKAINQILGNEEKSL